MREGISPSVARIYRVLACKFGVALGRSHRAAGRYRGFIVNDIEFPSMRRDVEDALWALSDEAVQRRWGIYEPERNMFDDLTLNLNILYDCHVFPDPNVAVGVIAPDEIEPIRELFVIFDPLLEELGDRPDADYLADPRWSAVMKAAQVALATMRRFDEPAT